jgi:hypothetical protein
LQHLFIQSGRAFSIFAPGDQIEWREVPAPEATDPVHPDACPARSIVRQNFGGESIPDHYCPANSLSLREKGRTIYTAGAEFHVPVQLITGKIVQSERLADGSTNLSGTAVIPDIISYRISSSASRFLCNDLEIRAHRHGYSADRDNHFNGRIMRSAQPTQPYNPSLRAQT